MKSLAAYHVSAFPRRTKNAHEGRAWCCRNTVMAVNKHRLQGMQVCPPVDPENGGTVTSETIITQSQTTDHSVQRSRRGRSGTQSYIAMMLSDPKSDAQTALNHDVQRPKTQNVAAVLNDRMMVRRFR